MPDAATFWTTFSQKYKNGFEEKCSSEEGVTRSYKVCVSAKCYMDTQAGEKYKHAVQETSYECPRCAVLLGAASSFSLYHQCKEYENKYKEIKSKEGNTD